MIEEIKVYQMVCDGCGTIHEYDGMIVHFDFEHQAAFSAIESDWKIINGKWYCPDCVERLFEYDWDNDTYVRKEEGNERGI